MLKSLLYCNIKISDIEDFICSELKIVNDRAGLTVMPGAHKSLSDETIDVVFL